MTKDVSGRFDRVQLAVRLDSGLLDRVERWGRPSTENPMGFHGAGRSSKIRHLLNGALACEAGDCKHAESASEWKRIARERGERVADLQAAMEALRDAAVRKVLEPAAPVQRAPLGDIAPWDVPDSPAPAEEDRSWLPVAWRGLDDRALAAKGMCTEHRTTRLECNGEHDDSV